MSTCDYSADSYTRDHMERFRVSLEWLATLDRSKPLRVLELGGHGAFTPLYRSRFPEDELHATTCDLRRGEAIMFEAGRLQHFDLVLCMEVLEHVNDVDPPNGLIATEWRGTGADSMLRATINLLRPGGKLFLTTPNAVSITVMHHAMRLVPPMLYRPHVREYAPYELDDLLRSAGFVIDRRETLDVWRNAITDTQHSRIVRFLEASGYPTTLRGEDLFVVAKRPEAARK
jgi:trans-aconitate methyltransferase